MNMIYRKGQIVGYVEARRSEVALPKRWYVRRCVPGRDARVIEQMLMLDICGWSPVRVRYVDRRTGRDAVRPHLGRRIASPFLPGLIFIPDFEAGNPALDNLDDVNGWLQITRAGVRDWDKRLHLREFAIADRYGNHVLPQRTVASLSIKDMAALREIVQVANGRRSGRGRGVRGKSKYSVAQTIYVADGPFAGFAAKIERLDSRGRLKAFIAALMGGVSVDLSETQVEPA